MSTELQLFNIETNVAALAGIVARNAGASSTLAAVLDELVKEMKRANTIHEQTLESLRAALRGDDESEAWKRGE